MNPPRRSRLPTSPFFLDDDHPSNWNHSRNGPDETGEQCVGRLKQESVFRWGREITFSLDGDTFVFGRMIFIAYPSYRSSSLSLAERFLLVYCVGWIWFMVVHLRVASGAMHSKHVYSAFYERLKLRRSDTTKHFVLLRRSACSLMMLLDLGLRLKGD